MYYSYYHKKKKFYVRFTAMICIVAIIMSAFLFKISDLQIVNAQKYLAQADTTSTRYRTVTASRGEIVDRYGRPLVSNNIGYNIVFDALYMKAENYNSIILEITELLRDNNVEWTDILPMETVSPYVFTQDSAHAVKLLKTNLNLANYATSSNCFDAMVEKYKLQGYDSATQRLLMGVRYSMEANDFSLSTNFILAENIDETIVALIEESDYENIGVKVETTVVREYSDSSLATHILGVTGPIFAEEWEQLKDTGLYKMNDYTGKSGIEKAAESYLKGTDGQVLVTASSDGKEAAQEIISEAVAGNTIKLTLDKSLQKVAQNSLENTIKELQQEREVTGGAVVVTDVNTGEILASASYPYYTIDDYNKNYDKLLKDKNNPLFNRAFNGTYAPGSTFKPATALIGLQLNAVTNDEEILCNHVYTRFEDYQPTCLGSHGNINVTEALAVSCNVFFYELSYRIGITQMNAYCKQLGLGVLTGVEVEESSGILAGPEYREKIGSYWTDGDTIQAGIGQSDNLFTPVQLAQYCATIANGGTRYKQHLIKSVMSYDLSTVIEDDFVEEVEHIDISDENINLVKQGMLSVTEEGTAQGTFSEYDIKVGGKTGTADAPNNKSNAVFIAFAPFDDPEIAVSIVIENGGHGSAIAPIAKEIFDAYFFDDSKKQYSDQTINTLLD